MWDFIFIQRWFWMAKVAFHDRLSAVQLWSREHSHQDKHERKYQKLPIEKKESYKWLGSAERSQRCLTNGGARLVTHIGDRESDLYEEFATVPDRQNHVLVRVCQDRRLLDKSQSLYTYLREQPCQGTYTINVPSPTNALVEQQEKHC